MKVFFKHYWLLAFISLFMGIDVMAQSFMVKGIILDSKDNMPLPGVNVVIKGTTTGTVTGLDGNYSIEAKSEDILVVSFIGYTIKEVPVAGKSEINISLTSGYDMDEVVVVGYGKIKKSDVTGAIASVKAEDLSMSASANVAQMMQGKAAGVQIIQQSAQPGGALKVLVRGAASTNANNEPLYIVDGFPISTDNLEGGYEVGRNYSSGVRSPLNSINPNDIESIEVLKDASSTAIYGARAANGVVLITTKRGKKGVKVTYDGRFSSQSMIRYMEVLNGSEFMRMYNEHRYQFDAINNNIYPYGTGDADTYLANYSFKYSDNDIAQAGKGTDWFSKVTRPGFIQDHNFSVRGGDENTQVFTSFNYYDHKGVVINSGLKRYSGRLNLDQEINKNIKIGVNFTGSSINNNNAALGAGRWERVGVISSAFGFPSIYPVYDEAGNYSVNELYSNNPNPVSFKHLTDNTVEKRWLGNAYVDIQIVKGLRLKPTIGFDNSLADRNSYTPDKTIFKEGGNGRGSRSKNQSMSNLFETVLNYDLALNENHRVGAMAGYSYQRFSGDGLYGYSEGYFTNVFEENSLQTGESNKEIRSYRYENRLASYFGRINYSLNNKYVMQFTARLDGSDKFGDNNKFGFFPSASLAWNVNKESFLLDQNTINDLKLRLGYGQTGNDNIGGNAYAYYGPGGFRYQFNNLVKTGLGKTSIANPDLKWETTTEANIGLDFGLWNNRLSGSLDLFSREVSDLLFLQPLQSFQEVSSIYMNVGKTRSTGWEFNIRGKILSHQALKWESYLNLSQYNDRWAERSKSAIENLAPYASVNGPLRPVYSYLPSHIFQIGDAQPYTNVSYVPGNLVVKDVGRYAVDADGNYILDKHNRRIIEKKADGIINDADVVQRGTQDPQLIIGFGNVLSYKNFELNFFFHGMLDYWAGNDNYEFYTARSEFLYGGFNRSKDFLDVWSTFNPDGKIPATPQTKIPPGYDALKYQSVSFIRLKNLTLSYNLPNKVYGTNIKVYVDAANLFTITNLKGMDPESTTFSTESQYNSNNTGNSFGFGAYPSVKTYTFGVSIDF